MDLFIQANLSFISIRFASELWDTFKLNKMK